MLLKNKLKVLIGFLFIFFISSILNATVQSTVNKITHLVSDIGQTEYIYDFRVDESDQMIVYLNDIQQSAGDYTVNDLGSLTGGTITISFTTVLDDQLLILREMPLTQLIHYIRYGKFPAATHEKGLDYGVMIDQQLSEQYSRVMRFPVYEDVDPILPSPQDQYALVWEDNALVNKLYANSGGEVLIHNDHDLNGRHIVYESIADLRSSTLTPFDGQVIKVVGYNSASENYEWFFKWNPLSTVTDDKGYNIKVTPITTGRFERLDDGIVSTDKFGAYLDDTNDDSQAIIDAFSYARSTRSIVSFTNGTMLIESALGVFEAVPKVSGIGWLQSGTDEVVGSAINTDQEITIGSVSELNRGTKLADFSINYTGSGVALTIDNIIQTKIENVKIDCNGLGTVGIEYQNDTYFAHLENVIVTTFTDVGVILDTGGTKNVVENCAITSGSGSDATAGLEIRDQGAAVYDGQINVERVDGLGVGILFNNTSGAIIYGGTVQGTLSERDIGIKITGTTHAFGNVVIRDTRYTMGNTTTGVLFDRAIGCKVINPSTTGPTSINSLVEWGDNSIDCGLIGGYNVARSTITVSALAEGAYKVCTDPITYAERANVTVDSNLIVTCEEVEYVGRTIHNGTSWDKFSESLTSDGTANSFTTITPPSLIGQMTIRTASGGQEYATVSYSVGAAVGSMIDILSGTICTVTSGDATLNGTTGALGDLTISASSDGFIYIENRRGGSRRFIAEFK